MKLVEIPGRILWGLKKYTYFKMFPAAWERAREIGNYEAYSKLGSNSPNLWIRKSSQIGGWLFHDEHEYLWELATRSQVGDILEIGSWMGKSSCILAGACIETAPNTRVICCDPFDMNGTDYQVSYHKALLKGRNSTLEVFLENARKFGFYDHVIPVVATSEKMLSSVHAKLRMAFLDGAHDYGHLQMEVDALWDQLLPQGVIAFHDTAENWPEVHRFIKEVMQIKPGARFLGMKRTISAFEKI